MSALWVCLALLGAPSVAVAAQSEARPGLPAPELPAVLDRLPADLPRAEPGRWNDFFVPERQGEIGRSLQPGVLDGMAVAQAAYQRGLFAQSLDTLHQVLAREPDFPPAWLVAGAAYWRLRRYGDSEHCFRRFLRVAPGEIHRTHGLAHALYGLGRYEEARDHYLAVAARVPDVAEVWRGLALSELRLGEPAAALAHADRWLALAPSSGDALAWRAQALLDLDRAEEALSDARRAGEIGPGDPRARWIAAEALAQLGREEEARAERALWRRLEDLAAQRRSIEARLLLHPHQPLLAEELVRNAAATLDRGLVAEALARAEAARRPDQSAYAVGVLAVETWLKLSDLERARAAALALERRAGAEARTWQRLALFWGILGEPDRAQAADARFRELGGGQPGPR